MLIPVNEVIIPNEWINEIGDIQIGEWKKINIKLNYIKEIMLRGFQFKINNRILVTNSFLIKKKKDGFLSMFLLQSRSGNDYSFTFPLWKGCRILEKIKNMARKKSQYQFAS